MYSGVWTYFQKTAILKILTQWNNELLRSFVQDFVSMMHYMFKSKLCEWLKIKSTFFINAPLSVVFILHFSGKFFLKRIGLWFRTWKWCFVTHTLHTAKHTIKLRTEAPGFYQYKLIHANIWKPKSIITDALAHRSYCISSTLLGITAPEKYLIRTFIRHKDRRKPFLMSTYKGCHRQCISTVSKTWDLACNRDPASISANYLARVVSGTQHLCMTWLLSIVLWYVTRYWDIDALDISDPRIQADTYPLNENICYRESLALMKFMNMYNTCTKAPVETLKPAEDSNTSGWQCCWPWVRLIRSLKSSSNCRAVIPSLFLTSRQDGLFLIRGSTKSVSATYNKHVNIVR